MRWLHGRFFVVHHYHVDMIIKRPDVKPWGQEEYHAAILAQQRSNVNPWGQEEYCAAILAQQKHKASLGCNLLRPCEV